MTPAGMLDILAEDRQMPLDYADARPQDFLGSVACKRCHPAEFQNHAHSRHATTFHSADVGSLGGLAPPAGTTGSGYRIVRRGNSLVFTPDGKIEHGELLQFALGSGKTGMTYVRLLGPKTLIEFSMSYYPAVKRWLSTPGQRIFGGHELGRRYEGDIVRKCLLCHTVAVDAKTGTPAPRYYGVGCESCHGPGRRHVAIEESAGSGSIMNDIGLPRLATWSSTRLIRMCGRCHRNGDDVQLRDSAMSGQTNRFMSYGLMRSACYQKSGKAISCTTCHDPHTIAAKSPAAYEAKCLTCHTSASHEGTTPVQNSTASEHAFTRKACPVNPQSGCIGCHMPTREVFAGLKNSTRMADHLIHIGRQNR